MRKKLLSEQILTGDISMYKCICIFEVLYDDILFISLMTQNIVIVMYYDVKGLSYNIMLPSAH